MTLASRRPPSIAAPGGNPTTRSSAHFARVPIGRGLGANGLPSLRTTELTRVARELDDRRRALDAREIAVRARERAALGADALDNALRRSDDDDDETRGFANSRRRDDDGETRETRETRRLRGVVGALEPALLDATRAARLAKRREHTVIARSEDAARSHARAETRLATRLRETEEALVKVTEERKALRARLAAAKARREKTDAAAAATAEKLAARERVAEDMRRDHESLMRQLLDAASLDERRVAEAANEAVAEARRGENDAKATTRAFAVKMKRAEEENRALTRRCRTLEEQVEFCLASIREDERRELKKAKGGGEAEEEEGDGDVAADENENENENEIEDEIAGNKSDERRLYEAVVRAHRRRGDVALAEVVKLRGRASEWESKLARCRVAIASKDEEIAALRRRVERGDDAAARERRKVAIRADVDAVTLSGFRDRERRLRGALRAAMRFSRARADAKGGSGETEASAAETDEEEEEAREDDEEEEDAEDEEDEVVVEVRVEADVQPKITALCAR